MSDYDQQTGPGVGGIVGGLAPPYMPFLGIPGMKQSSAIDKLAASYILAQAVITTPPKNKEVEVKSDKGKYSFWYTTLDALMEHVRAPLTSNGLWLLYGVDNAERKVWTTLIHTSGQWVSVPTPYKTEKDTMQGYGSAETYAMRYGTRKILGISSEEDDDGNIADGNHIEKSQTREVVPSKGKGGAKQAAPKTNGQAEDDLKARAVTLANAITQCVDENEVDEVLKQNAKTVAEMEKAKPAWHAHLLTVVSDHRKSFNLLAG